MRLQHQILYSRDISSKTQVIWFKQEWIRNNLLIHHIGTLRRNTVTDQTGLNRSFVKSTILHDALFNLLDSILIKVACSWHNLSSVTGKKICGLKRSFFRCIIFLTCHYIVFVLKQAVLSKSKHGGNNASIIGEVRLHRINKFFRTRINGDLVAGIGLAWFVVPGSRRRYDKHLSENSSIRVTSMSM